MEWVIVIGLWGCAAIHICAPFLSKGMTAGHASIRPPDIYVRQVQMNEIPTLSNQTKNLFHPEKIRPRTLLIGAEFSSGFSILHDKFVRTRAGTSSFWTSHFHSDIVTTAQKIITKVEATIPLPVWLSLSFSSSVAFSLLQWALAAMITSSVPAGGCQQKVWLHLRQLRKKANTQSYKIIIKSTIISGQNLRASPWASRLTY